MCGIFVVAILPLALGSVIDTIAYDCTHPDTEMNIIAASIVEECPQHQKNLYESSMNVQLIQERIFERIKIQHCLITSLSLTMYCGMFSHMSAIQKGLLRNILQITEETCRDIPKNGFFNYAGHVISDLKPNTSRNVDVVEYGSLDNQGNCEGVDIISEHGSHKNAVVITTLEIDLSEYHSVYNTLKNEIILED